MRFEDRKGATMKGTRRLMWVGIIGLIGLFLTDRDALRAQGGSGTILFEPPPPFRS